MSIRQVIGIALVGFGIVELVTTILLVARRRRGDTTAVRAIGLALLVSAVLSTVGLAIATSQIN